MTAAYARPRSPVATIVVAHGAGAGMDHPFLVGFARACIDDGVATMRFNFPYIESGRRSPDTEAAGRDTWSAAFDAALEAPEDGAGLGGREVTSAGGSPRCARPKEIDPAGLVFLGYPLHPPGKPERIRDEHLYRVRSRCCSSRAPAIRSPAGAPPRVVKKLGERATLHQVDGGDHSFKVRARSSTRGGRCVARAARGGFVREHAV